MPLAIIIAIAIFVMANRYFLKAGEKNLEEQKRLLISRYGEVAYRQIEIETLSAKEYVKDYFRMSEHWIYILNNGCKVFANNTVSEMCKSDFCKKERRMEDGHICIHYYYTLTININEAEELYVNTSKSERDELFNRLLSINPNCITREL